MSPDKLTDRGSSKHISRLSQRAQLWLVALLTLFVGMEVGFLIATGGALAVFEGLSAPFDPAYDGTFILGGLAGWTYFVLMAKPLRFLARDVREGFVWTIGILVVLLSILTNNPEFIVYSWLWIVTILALGTPPVWLTVGVGFVVAIALYLFEMPYAVFALPIIAIGFLRYPEGISFKRFLFPSRGVM